MAYMKMQISKIEYKPPNYAAYMKFLKYKFAYKNA